MLNRIPRPVLGDITGALGDLGTLLPLAAGMILLAGVDPGAFFVGRVVLLDRLMLGLAIGAHDVGSYAACYRDDFGRLRPKHVVADHAIAGLHQHVVTPALERALKLDEVRFGIVRSWIAEHGHKPLDQGFFGRHALALSVSRSRRTCESVRFGGATLAVGLDFAAAA